MDWKPAVIRRVKKELEWAYEDCNWLSPEQAIEANRKRDCLLKQLIKRGAHYKYKKSKILNGQLSPGCKICAEGRWSCLYMNLQCTANCFFCPQDRDKIPETETPYTCGIKFRDSEDYLTYLEKFGAKGIGLSGGEGTLVFGQQIDFIAGIRRKFGEDIYIWLYTNGDLIDKNKLSAYKKAGLNEIRFNICTNQYSLEKVALAKEAFENVGIEIPAIPEDMDTLKSHFRHMCELGVKFLNLHQLRVTRNNYKNFNKRNYSFLHGDKIVVYESEIAALELIEDILTKGYNLPVQYCSSIYKSRFQTRWGKLLDTDDFLMNMEDITATGFIRKLSFGDDEGSNEKIVEDLLSAGIDKNLWAWDTSTQKIVFHKSVLKFFKKPYPITIEFFEPEIAEGINREPNHCELKLNPKRTVCINKRSLHSFKVASLTGQKFIKGILFDELSNREILSKELFSSFPLNGSDDVYGLMKETEALLNIFSYEVIEEGFPEIF